MRNSLSRLLLVATVLGLGVIKAQTPKPPDLDLQVQLTTTIKAKKVKVGDAVSAITVAPMTLAQGLVIPAESKVTGHVRQVEADSGDAHSSLIALSFDEITLKNGQKVPLNCFVRAALLPGSKGTTTPQGQADPMLSPNRGAGNSGMGGYISAGNAGGMMAGTPVANGTPRDGTSTTDAKPADPVAAHSGQVIGMPGVELQITSPDHLSVFKSVHKNLELGEGLQLMLDVLQ